MSEMVRFRRARAPRRHPEDARAVYRILRVGENPTPFLTSVREALKAPLNLPDGSSENDRRLALAARLAGSLQSLSPHDNESVFQFLVELDRAILAFSLAPSPDELEELLNDVLARAPVNVPPQEGVTLAKRLAEWSSWTQIRRWLGDLIVWAHLQRAEGLSNDGTTVTGGVDTLERANRLLLLVGLLEAVGFGKLVIKTKKNVADLLFHRTVLLPSPPFPLQRHAPLLAPTRFARRPAIVDLAVIRDEWCCFIPGEIAHIENVLKSELKERTHQQLDESETTDTRDNSTLKVDEHSTQTLERSSLEEETEREVRLSLSLEGQVDFSANYGTMQIETHVGADVQVGYNQTEHRVSQQAREIVDRVANRFEERVRRVRTERVLRRTEETNVHTLDNTQSPNGNIVGVYRWVDKIKRLRSFVYPQRYAFEFQVAEPGARLRWLKERQPDTKILTRKPPAFTTSGEDTASTLAPHHITRNNYMQLTSTFRASGTSEPPPGSLDIAGGIELNVEQTLQTDTFASVQNVPRAVGKTEISVPPGYLANKLRATLVAVPQLAKWRDSPETGGDFYEDLVGYHAIVATVSASSLRLNLKSTSAAVQQSFDAEKGVDFPAMWNGTPGAVLSAEGQLPGPCAQQVTVAATMAGSHNGHVSVSLMCDLSDQAFQEWQLSVYDRLLTAHQAWQSRYDDEKRGDATSTGISIAGESPSKNRERIQEELKRQIIELIMGRDFHGYELMRTPIDSMLGPAPDFGRLAAATPTIQFLEQAFEWHNITYVPYPFYWRGRNGWPSLEQLRDNDADFERFLRAGSARVVVPARNGYEYAIEYYAFTGEPWSGGAAPAPDEPLYVSVAREIRELTGGGEQGSPEDDMWEVRQPTTLVWLDGDFAMPKHNEYLSESFKGQPNPKICPDVS